MANHFSFKMDLSKAYEENGRPYVDAVVSDNREDQQKHTMSDKALASMLGFLKSGYEDASGNHTRVWLLSSHNASFPMGEAVDGHIEKTGYGDTEALELHAKFALDAEDRDAKRLYKSVADGTCRHQLSIGGDAIGHPSVSKATGAPAMTLDDITLLEHIACTRPHRAAVSATGFVSAIYKSLESDPAFTAFTIKEEDTYQMDATKEAALDATILELKKGIADLLAIAAAAPVAAAPVAAPVEVVKEVVLAPAAFIAPVDQSVAILAAIEKGFANAIAAIGTPQERTRSVVPANAIVVEKTAPATIAEATAPVTGADGKTELESYLEKGAARQVVVKKAMDAAQYEIRIEKTAGQAGAPTTEVTMARRRLVDESSELATKMSYARATGIMTPFTKA